MIFLGIYYGMISNGINGIVVNEKVQQVTEAEFLDKENEKEFEAVFKGIIKNKPIRDT